MTADKKPLYQDEKLKIDYHPKSTGDYTLQIKSKRDELSVLYFTIPKGCLENMAKAPRGGIEKILNAFDDSIPLYMKTQMIGIDGLHVAICQAYAEEERQVREYRKELERNNDDRRENSDAF